MNGLVKNVLFEEEGVKTKVTVESYHLGVNVMLMNMNILAMEACWDKFRRGANIQDAFPFLSADEREFLLTGTTPEKWDEMFPKEDEDEDLDAGDPGRRT